MGETIAPSADRIADAAVLGYATRSRRSALVMRAVDLLRPAARDSGPPELRGTCVVSSVAGVGDLFIHLPLVEGIVAAVRKNGGTPLVALRPAHAAIGRACGWDVLEYENPLQDLFGGTVSRSVLTRVATDAAQLRKREIDLWLDLTGNAFNALALRFAGAKRIAGRVTRGGRSLTHHWLPNEAFENEYANRDRLADYLGCGLDLSVFRRIANCRPAGHVVLGMTTNCPWKNWPLERFRDLIVEFPDRPFLLVGMENEIPPETAPVFRAMCEFPNVTSKVGRSSLMELVADVATADAVVTNDTGTAHIANAFGVPGAVLFGPTMSEQWSIPEGLRVFHDRSCPHYPCAAWKCARPDEWCMRKIAVPQVADWLRELLPADAPLFR